jgi:hypothetical protein
MEWLYNLPPKQAEDYDLAGYIAKYGVPDQSKGQHLTDEFKMPNHMTFSDESMYSNPTTQGGHWDQGGQNLYSFTPSQYNLENTPATKLIDYFKNVEQPGTYLNMGKKMIGNDTYKDREQQRLLSQLKRMLTPR